ncbi:hypothetical protein [Methylobacterium thuringiense]|uniref:hypothetical protein n=1 Tax=Methylobacterium thuringiense TaxID=1003091 RepID=UPI001EDEAB26|nr:hypothetical protein [Methylobacterium thuringiense]
MIVDLIYDGADLNEDGSVTPMALQAATHRARDWLGCLAMKIGQMIDGVLMIYGHDDIAFAFDEMPDEFVLI